MQVEDGPGMLRARLRDEQRASGSGNDFATVLVVAEHAERAAFARQALAIKLRELNAKCEEREYIIAEVARVQKECQALARECAAYDYDLDQSIRGNLRKAG